MIYAELHTDAGRECRVRADTAEHFLHDVFYHFHSKVYRKRYREERAYAEIFEEAGMVPPIDLGGEA